MGGGRGTWGATAATEGATVEASPPGITTRVSAVGAHAGESAALSAAHAGGGSPSTTASAPTAVAAAPSRTEAFGSWNDEDGTLSYSSGGGRSGGAAVGRLTPAAP